MSTPSWPRLAGWLATAQPPAARGRWRTREAGRETTGTFAHRPPDLALVRSDDGRSAAFSPDRLWTFRPERGEDYHRAAGPVVAVEHDGRPCWQVALLPPSHKSGLLVLVVDDATGLLLRQSNADHDRLEEVTDLHLDAVVTDAELEPVLAARRAAVLDQARHELARRRPVPTPAWFPWRRLLTVDVPDCWLVTSDRGEGAVGRAPLGTPAPVPDWLTGPVVHRFERGGWSWAVAGELDEAAAHEVVDRSLEHPAG